ncbi:MAG: beta-galactosidase [Candidatus Hydrogenedentes bacterium]|nr:beta-galactosidase [Candidatus Hydrogenedentota bacterium]
MTFVLCLLTLAASDHLPVAKVEIFNGAPALVVNGQPYSGMAYMTYAPTPEYFSDFGEAGVELYSFSATPTESTYNLAAECWIAPDTFDYTQLDERMAMVLQAEPDALIVPRLFLGTPPWWAETYPEDLVTYDPDDGIPEAFVLDGKRVASWASEKWRDDTSDALRRFVAHVEQSSYAKHVIGYHLASGTTEEWMQWGSNEDQWTDYSAPNVNRFRSWLEDKYVDLESFRSAWNDDDVTFATAAIPTKAQRAAAQHGYLKDPAVDQASIDYVLYTSWLTVDAIKAFAAVVKKATHGERLVGTFYGYLLSLSGAQREQNAGHLALDQLLTCPDIDFLCSPTDYGGRDLDTGFPHTMTLLDSVKQHGKLWFNENDLRTWLTPNVEVGTFGKTGSYEDSLRAQQREFTWVMAERLGMWWFDMGGGWFHDPQFMKDIAHMNRIAEACVGLSGESVAEIALVADMKSSAYVQPGASYGWHVFAQQYLQLGHIGAPFDSMLLSDLPMAKDYRLYIFPNCFAPTDEERLVIRETLDRTGATAVWIGPAGIYRNGAWEPAAMADLTGFSLVFDKSEHPWRVAPTEAAADWGWISPETYGERSGAIAYVSAPSKLDVLGMIDGKDVPALVSQEQDGRLAINSTDAPLPTSLLRAVAQKAGVHLYLDQPGIVWATRELVGVYAANEEIDKISLPSEHNVVELFSNSTPESNGDTVIINLKKHRSALLHLK